MDFKHGFYRDYKFSEFYAFEMAIEESDKAKAYTKIIYHTYHKSNEITPILSDKDIQALYQHLNQVVINKTVVNI